MRGVQYIIVYVNNPNSAPELPALKLAYEKLDRRYKKNLHRFFVVSAAMTAAVCHSGDTATTPQVPSTLFIDTAITFISPFVSEKVPDLACNAASSCPFVLHSQGEGQVRAMRRRASAVRCTGLC